VIALIVNMLVEFFGLCEVEEDMPKSIEEIIL